MAFTIVALVSTIWLALVLQTGSSGIYLFILNDVLTDPPKLTFILGFPATYLVSLLVVVLNLRIPRFDFLNRIVVINVVIYSFFGLSLSSLRLLLVSREVFITEFLLSSILLVAYNMICHRFYPKRFGILGDVDITPFKTYPSLEAIPIDASIVQKKHLDGVITNLRDSKNDHTIHLLADLVQQRIQTYDANTLIETLWGRTPLTNITLVEIETFRPSMIYGLVKRAIELALIIVFTPLLSVMALLIGIAIKLDSPGPIFFTQSRTGKNGNTFTMYKFRSMFDSGDSGIQFAEEKDKRITGVGRVLRRLRLDELPQLWNVVLADMSLIGPRPEQLEFTKRFNMLIPYYGFRHTIRPGVTGWSQVMYGYAASDEQTRAKLEYDIFYIKHMSLWLDFVVLVKTIRTIILGSGSR